jgi:hypothetical protein
LRTLMEAHGANTGMNMLFGLQAQQLEGKHYSDQEIATFAVRQFVEATHNSFLPIFSNLMSYTADR